MLGEYFNWKMKLFGILGSEYFPFNRSALVTSSSSCKIYLKYTECDSLSEGGIKFIFFIITIGLCCVFIHPAQAICHYLHHEGCNCQPEEVITLSIYPSQLFWWFQNGGYIVLLLLNSKIIIVLQTNFCPNADSGNGYMY